MSADGTAPAGTYARRLRLVADDDQDETTLPLDAWPHDPRTRARRIEVDYDLAKIRRDVDRDALTSGCRSLWRYAPLLPVANAGAAVTLGEGGTPLLRAEKLGATIGYRDLWIKDEGRNPSATFKDRGASVAVTRLRELGIDDVILASSGNAGAAWALYCARAGIACTAVLPDDALEVNRRQCRLSGARVEIVDGPWQGAGERVERLARSGSLVVSTLREPYRLEGKRTLGFEIAEQLGWRLPDVIVYPTGGGTGLLAIAKAMRELIELDWVPERRLPRFLITQYEGCSPIVRAFRTDAAAVAPWEEIRIPPGGLKAADPPGGNAALALLRETDGSAVAVRADDAREAARLITTSEGVFPCLESATTVVGLRRALADGRIEAGERVVVVNTGSGVKSSPI